MERRIISTEINSEDEKIENHLRPQKLDEYIGQEASKEKLKVYIDAAKARGESLDAGTVHYRTDPTTQAVTETTPADSTDAATGTTAASE